MGRRPVTHTLGVHVPGSYISRAKYLPLASSPLLPTNVSLGDNGENPFPNNIIVTQMVTGAADVSIKYTILLISCSESC